MGSESLQDFFSTLLCGTSEAVIVSDNARSRVRSQLTPGTSRSPSRASSTDQLLYDWMLGCCSMENTCLDDPSDSDGSCFTMGYGSRWDSSWSKLEKCDAAVRPPARAMPQDDSDRGSGGGDDDQQFVDDTSSRRGDDEELMVLLPVDNKSLDSGVVTIFMPTEDELDGSPTRMRSTSRIKKLPMRTNGLAI